jgi:hypothetical protein
MTQNMGLADRAIRLLVAILIVVLFAAHRISGWVGIVLAIVAIILALTSLFAVCPLYLLFKVSTKARRPTPPAETPPSPEA